MAMEARCYHGGDNRTQMKPLHYEARDHIAYVVMFAYLAIAIVFRIVGIWRRNKIFNNDTLYAVIRSYGLQHIIYFIRLSDWYMKGVIYEKNWPCSCLWRNKLLRLADTAKRNYRTGGIKWYSVGTSGRKDWNHRCEPHRRRCPCHGKRGSFWHQHTHSGRENFLCTEPETSGRYPYSALWRGRAGLSPSLLWQRENIRIPHSEP